MTRHGISCVLGAALMIAAPAFWFPPAAAQQQPEGGAAPQDAGQPQAPTTQPAPAVPAGTATTQPTRVGSRALRNLRERNATTQPGGTAAPATSPSGGAQSQPEDGVAKLKRLQEEARASTQQAPGAEDAPQPVTTQPIRPVRTGGFRPGRPAGANTQPAPEGGARPAIPATQDAGAPRPPTPPGTEPAEIKPAVTTPPDAGAARPPVTGDGGGAPAVPANGAAKPAVPPVQDAAAPQPGAAKPPVTAPPQPGEEGAEPGESAPPVIKTQPGAQPPAIQPPVGKAPPGPGKPIQPQPGRPIRPAVETPPLESVTATSPAEDPEGRSEWFSFDRTPWDEVLDHFAARLGKVWMNRDDFTEGGELTYKTTKRFTKDEAIDELNLLMHEKGWRFVEIGDHIYVKPINELPQMIPVKQVFDTVEAFNRANPRDMDFCRVYITIVDQPAQKIVDMFGDSLPDYVLMSAIAETNQIKITALARDVRKFLALRELVPLDPKDPREIKVYKIETNASEMAEMVRTMVATSAAPQRRFDPVQKRFVEQPATGAPGDDSVRIVPDARTNTLIVKATPDIHAQIQEVLDTLGKKVDIGKFGTHVIEIKNGNAADIAALLNQIFGQERGQLASQNFQRLQMQQQRMRGGQVPPPQPGQPQPGQPGQPQIAGAAESMFGIADDPAERARKLVQLFADERTNSLIVYANEDGLQRVKNMLEIIDQPIPSNLRTIKLQHAKVDDIAQPVQQIVNDIRGTSGGRGMQVGGRGPTVVPDAATNSFHIIADRDALKRVEEVISLLDAPGAELQRHMIQLTNLAPSKVQQTVQLILEKRSGAVQPGAPGGGFRAGRLGGGAGGGAVKVGSGAEEGYVIALDEIGMLIVACAEEQWAEVESVVKLLDEQAVSSNPQMRTFTLAKGDPTQVSNTLNTFYRQGYRHPTLGVSPVFIAPLDDTLYVQAIGPALDEIAGLIEKMDVEPQLDPLVILPLAHADATQVAQLVLPMVQSGGRPGMRPGAPGNSVQAEPMTNSLVIRADEATLNKVTEFVTDLDQRVGARVPEKKFYVLRFADPNQVSQAVNSMFNTGAGGIGSRFGGGGRGSVNATPAGSQVIVDAPQEKQKEIGEFIAKLDDPGGREIVIKTILVPSADVQTIAQRLTDAWSERQRRQPSLVARFSADPSTNTIVLTASRDAVEEAEKQIEEFRKIADSAGKIAVETRKLPGLDVNNLANQLQQIFQARPRRADNLQITFRADPQTETVIINAPKDALTEIDALIAKFAAEAADLTVEQKAFTLQFVDANFAAERIRDQVVNAVQSRKGPEQARKISVSADPRMNQVTVTGPRLAVTMTEDLLKQIDVDVPEAGIATLELKFADANQLVTVINQMFNQGGRPGSRGGGAAAGQDVLVQANGGRLIVKAPPKKLEEIKDVVARLDAKGEDLDVKTYTLKKLDATQVSLAVQTALFASGVQAKPGQLKPGAYPEPKTNTLVVMADKSVMPFVDMLIAKLEAIDSPTAEARAYALKNARAEQVQQNVDAILRTKVQEAARPGAPPVVTSVVADPAGNRLVVLAPDEFQDLVRDVIGLIDSEVTTGEIVHIIRLENADATTLAQTLQGVRGAGRGQQQKVAISADASSNSLILAGLPRDVAEIENLIKELEAENVTVPELQIFALKNTEADALLETLESIFPTSRNPADNVVISADMYTNRLFVTANRRKMRVVESYIQKLDVEPPLDGSTIAGLPPGKELYFVDITRGSADDIAYDVRSMLRDPDEGGPDIDTDWFGQYIKVICRPSEIDGITKLIREFESRAKVETKVVTIKPRGDMDKLLQYLIAKNPDLKVQTVEDPAGKSQSIVEEVRPKDELPDELRRRPRPASDENEGANGRGGGDRVRPAVESAKPAGRVQPFALNQHSLDRMIDEIEQQLEQPAPPAGPRLTRLASRQETPRADADPAPAKQEPPPARTARPATTQPALPPAGPAELTPEALRNGRAAEKARQESAPAAPQKPVTDAQPPPPPSLSKSDASAAAGPGARASQAGPAAPPKREQPQIVRLPDGRLLIQGPENAVEDVEDAINLLEEDLAEGEVIRIFKFNFGDVSNAAMILDRMFNDRQVVVQQPQQPQQPQPGRGGQPGQPGQPGQQGGKEGQGNQQDMRQQLMNMMGAQAQGGRGARGGRGAAAGGQRVRYATDPGHDYLIVKCDAADLPEIRQLLRELDIPPGEVDLKVYQLRNNDAEEMANNLKEVLGITRSGRGGPGGGMQGRNPQQQQMLQVMQQQLVVDLPGSDAGAKIDSVEIVPNRITNSLLVSAPPEVMTVISDMINRLESLDARDVVVIQHYELQKAKVDDLLPLLQELFSSAASGGGGGGGPGGGGRARGGNPASLGPVTISGDPRTNTLIFTAEQKDVEQVVAQIERLDIAGPLAEGQLYICQYGDATTIASMVDAVYGSGATPAGGDGGRRRPSATTTPVRIEPDVASNSILVFAPADQRKTIIDKIKELDELNKLNVVREIPVQYADPTRLADRLNEIFAGGPSAAVMGGGGRRPGRGSGATGGAQRVTIVGDANAKKLLVRAPDRIFSQIEDTVALMDVPDEQLQIRRFALKHANAEAVVASVEEGMTKYLTLAARSNPDFKMDAFSAMPDPRTNSIVVVGSPQTFLMVDMLLREIDTLTPEAQQKVFEIFALSRADAQTVAEAINSQSVTAAAAGGGGRRGGRMGGMMGGGGNPAGELNVVAFPETETNSVMVFGTQGDVEAVRDTIIAGFEQQDDQFYTPVTIAVKEAKPSELANFIQQFLAEGDAGQGGRGGQGGSRRRIQILPNDANGTIVVAGTRPEVERVKALAASFDNKDLVPEQLKIVPVPYGQNAAEVAREVERVFNEHERTVARAQNRQPREVAIGVNEQANALIVFGDPAVAGMVETVVGGLAEVVTVKPVTRVIQLTNLSADDAATMISELQNRRSGSGGGSGARRGGTGGGFPSGGFNRGGGFQPGGGGFQPGGGGFQPGSGGFQPGTGGFQPGGGRTGGGRTGGGSGTFTPPPAGGGSQTTPAPRRNQPGARGNTGGGPSTPSADDIRRRVPPQDAPRRPNNPAREPGAWLWRALPGGEALATLRASAAEPDAAGADPALEENGSAVPGQPVSGLVAVRPALLVALVAQQAAAQDDPESLLNKLRRLADAGGEDDPAMAAAQETPPRRQATRPAQPGTRPAAPATRPARQPRPAPAASDDAAATQPRRIAPATRSAERRPPASQPPLRRAVQEALEAAATQEAPPPAATQPLESVSGSLKGDVLATPLDSKRLVVTGDESDIEFIEQILAIMEATTFPSAIEVIPLENNKASAIQPILQQTMEALIAAESPRPGPGDRVLVVAEARSNSLIVSANEYNMERIRGLIARLDQVTGIEGTQFKTVPVDNIQASLAAAKIAPIVERLNRMREVPAEAQATVEADDRSNSLIIVGTSKDVEEIERLIEAVDIEIPEDKDDPRSFTRSDMIIIPLKNALAEDVATTLTDMIEAEQTAAREGVGAGGGAGGGAARRPTAVAVRKLRLRLADGTQLPELDLERPIRILAEKGTNSLIVYSSSRNNESLQAIVAVFDTLPLGADTEVRAFTLQHGNAETVAELLTKVFDDGKKSLVRPADSSANSFEKGVMPPVPPSPSGRGLPYPVLVAPDVRSNTIVVVGRKDAIALAGGLIADLDRPGLDLAMSPHLIPLKNSNATELSERLTEILDKRAQALGADQNAARDNAVIAPDFRSNGLIVFAGEDMFKMVQDLARQLDLAESYTVVGTKTRQLKYADANKIKSLLQEVFDRKKEAQSETAGGGNNQSRDALFITADTRSNSVVLTATRDYLAEAEKLIDNLDQAFDPTVVFKVRPVKLNSAANIAALLTDMIEKAKVAEGGGGEAALSGTPIYVSSDPLSDSLLLAASAEDIVMLDRWIDVLDRPTEVGRRQVIIPLRRGKAEDVAKAVGDLFRSGGGSGAGGASTGAIDVTVTHDATTNSVIAFGPPALLPDIEDMIKKLDRVEPAGGALVRIFKLRQADAEAAGDLLNSILEGGSGAVGGTGGTGGATRGGGGAGDTVQAVMLLFEQQHPDANLALLRGMRSEIRVLADLRTNSLVITAPPDSMPLMESLVAAVDVPPDAAKIRVFPLRNSDAAEMVRMLSELFSGETTGGGRGGGATTGGGTLEEGERRLVLEGGAGATSGREQLSFTTDARTNSVIAAGTTGYLDLVEQLILELDTKPIDELKVIVYQPAYKEAQSIADSIREYNDAQQQRLEALGEEVSIQRKQERAIISVANEDSNAIVLGYNPRFESDVLQIVHDLDQPPPQVMIQVLVLEVTMDNSLELGIEFAGQDLQFAKAGPNDTTTFDYIGGTDLGAAGTGLGGFTFTVTGKDFNFLLRTLQNQGHLRVLSRPQVVAMDNEEAYIKIINDVPYVNSTSTSIAGQITTSVAREDIGIELTVTPNINPDDFVRLEIEQIVSDFTGSTVDVGQGVTAPVFFRREAKTIVTVKDNETVVLGGLITSREETREQRIPIVGDIPGLGVLFRNQQDTSSRTELLIVMTPQVVRTVEDYRNLSISERNRTGVIPPELLRHPLMQGLREIPVEPTLEEGRLLEEAAPSREIRSIEPREPAPASDPYGPKRRSPREPVAPPDDANSYNIPISRKVPRRRSRAVCGRARRRAALQRI